MDAYVAVVPVAEGERRDIDFILGRLESLAAQRLYRALGYGDGAAPHRFLTKPL